MLRRAAQEAETQRRIVDAALAIQAERGLAGAKPPEIAARANVALTTYYKHFPSRAALVRTCMARGRDLIPPPDPAVVTSLPADPTVRIATMVKTLFEYYEVQERWLYLVRTEERFVPEVQEVMEPLRAIRDTFVAGALAKGAAGRVAVGVLTALVDFWAWRTLRRDLGLSEEEAIRGVTHTAYRALGIAGPRPGR